MRLFIDTNAEKMGKRAADDAAQKLCAAIRQYGKARLLLSTGASQFEVLHSLVGEEVDWSRVEMFHLDEYVGLSPTHPASFQRYLRERFADIVHPAAAYFVDGNGDVEKNIRCLTEEIRKSPINVALVGIGENGHIAFNDPPADFETKEAYKVVPMSDEICRRQQMNEGWFHTIEEVPEKAISMTVPQIMLSQSVISVVGGRRKAQAVRNLMNAKEITPVLPATKLLEHRDWTLYLDKDSASLLTEEQKRRSENDREF